MKICHCRNIDESDAAKAIKDHKIGKAEDVHRNICGKPPDCGSCLANIQSLIDVFNTTGGIPALQTLTMEQRRAAAQSLCERFTQEEKGNAAKTPDYKERYTRLYKNVCTT